MPAIETAPYSHSVYHDVTDGCPSIALAKLEALDGIQAINTVIRDCFLKHNVQRQFTACLNHRHFDCHANEQNIAEPDGRAMASANTEGVVPCSWLFHNGKLYPYEFTRGEEAIQPPAEFIDELGVILKERGLCDLIGVQVYNEGVVGVEHTDVEKRISTTKNYPEDAPEVQGRPHPRAVMGSFAFF